MRDTLAELLDAIPETVFDRKSVPELQAYKALCQEGHQDPIDLEVVETEFNGTCGLSVWYDSEQDELYALVGYTLNDRLQFAEIDDGTYGSLQGFRVYLDI